MIKKWIVYCHTNKINGKKYVGITSQNANRRWRTNGNGYKQKHQHKFYNAILKYGWDNFDHEILEENISTLEEANNKEKYYIEFYDSFKNGYNATLGGDGVNGHKWTEEMKIEQSNRLKGIKFTKEHKEKISKSLKGKKMKKETIDKIMKSKNRDQPLKVKQYDLNKNFIKEYFSIHEASKETGIGRKEISMCCKKIKSHYTAGGYIWEFS